MKMSAHVKLVDEMDGEAEAFNLGVSVAARMIGEKGVVTPTVVALSRETGGWTCMWEMDITEAVRRGNEGLQEVGFVLSKVVSNAGCDLSSMGVRPEHFKADAVVLVAEGVASGLMDSGEEATWRSLSLEMKTTDHMVAMLYRVVESQTETTLELVGRAVAEGSPLFSATATLH
jgi:hypothetical protein